MRYVLRHMDEVAHFWANKVQPMGKAGNVYFEGETIYSYGSHFPIAKHYQGGVAFTSRSYSHSTSKHKSVTRRAIPGGTCVVYVPRPDATAHSQMLTVRRSVEELLDKASRARERKAILMAQAMQEAGDFNTYAEWRGEECRITVSSDLSAFREEMRAAEMAAIERDRKRAAEAEARNAEGIAEWVAGGRAPCPHTVRPKLRLSTLDGDRVVETSWGAVIPVRHAERIWPLILKRRDAGAGLVLPSPVRVGNYTMTAIRGDGSIVVGCHDIAFEEIERIAQQLGLLTAELA